MKPDSYNELLLVKAKTKLQNHSKKSIAISHVKEKNYGSL